MSDDIERRLRDAFHGGSLPPAPASWSMPFASCPTPPSGHGDQGRAVRVRAARRRRRHRHARRLSPVTGGSFRARPVRRAFPLVARDGRIRLEYQVRPVDGVAGGRSDGDRLDPGGFIAATGAVDATVEADGWTGSYVTLPGVTESAAVPDVARRVGRGIDFVPLGPTPVSTGEPSIFAYPSLFGGDQIASASGGVDHSGQPAIDSALGPEGPACSPTTLPGTSGRPSPSRWTACPVRAGHPGRHPGRGRSVHRRGRRRHRCERGVDHGRVLRFGRVPVSCLRSRGDARGCEPVLRSAPSASLTFT